MSTAPSTEDNTEAIVEAKLPFLRRVRIRGYKSIAFCDVTLEPLTILVGRNASGKSNFLDALAFLRDLMEVGVAEAVKRRGGWPLIHCRTSSENVIGIDVELACTGWVPPSTSDSSVEETSGIFLHVAPGVPASPNSGLSPERSPVPLAAYYSIEIANQIQEQPRVVVEKLRISNEQDGSEFVLDFDHGRFTFDVSGGPNWIPSRLSPHMTRLEPFFLRAIYEQPFIVLADGLRWIRCYNFNPDVMRPPQKPNPGSLLERDGSNFASVIETTRENDEKSIERVGRYLSVITESVELLDVAKVFDYETVRFRVARNGQGQPLEFNAESMSDGTLRVLAALVAVFQIVLPHGSPSLVAIEEPETALHPAAMRALLAAMDEATLRTQILLTTHSPDLLDAEAVKPANIRVVQMIDGQTVIGPVDEASVEIVGRDLNSLGGLERENQLEPDLDDLDRQRHLAQTPPEPPA